jgi:hypothetical protein
VRIFEPGDEKVFKLNRNKGNYPKSLTLYHAYCDNITVPIIVVITQFDLYIKGLTRRKRLNLNISQPADQTFKQTFGHKFDKGGVSRDRPIPYALVSSMFASEVAPSALTMYRIDA